MATPEGCSANVYLAEDQYCAYTSADVATPCSPKAAERASGLIRKEGTAVAIGR